jgi:hypothetical protein
MVRRLALVLLPLAFLGLTSCKGKCQELAERVCECEANPTERDACNADIARAENAVNPTSDQDDRCEALLDSCQPGDGESQADFCRRLELPEGKLACGLAEAPPASTTP